MDIWSNSWPSDAGGTVVLSLKRPLTAHVAPYGPTFRIGSIRNRNIPQSVTVSRSFFQTTSGAHAGSRLAAQSRFFAGARLSQTQLSRVSTSQLNIDKLGIVHPE